VRLDPLCKTNEEIKQQSSGDCDNWSFSVGSDAMNRCLLSLLVLIGCPDGGGVVSPDAGSAEVEDQDVFIDNPLGTYALIEPLPGVEGIVFADNHGMFMMSDLETCTPFSVFAEWNIDVDGRLMVSAPEEPQPTHMRGAVLPNGDVRLSFPGGEGILLREVDRDCHVLESHLGTWRYPRRAPLPSGRQTGFVYTEGGAFISMGSLDPCYPVMSRSYDLSGPWLRADGQSPGGTWGEAWGIYIKDGRLWKPFYSDMLGFERDESCADGQMSLPPAELVGTYRVVEGQGPAELIALSADGTLLLLDSASPCQVNARGQYTANNTRLAWQVGEGPKFYQYAIEGSRIQFFREMDSEGGPAFTVERIRSACH
jgi:hypothetical protein